MKRFIREKELPPIKKEEFELPFKDWEVLCNENGKDCYEYLSDEDMSFFNPQNIGITGKELPGKKTEEIDGKIYEYNLIGNQSSKIKVKIQDKNGKEKIISLFDLYNELEKRSALGEKLNNGIFKNYASVIREYFKRNLDANRERNLFIRDMEDSINDLLSSIKTNKENKRFMARVYPSIDTPLDAFGADFFVEVDDIENGSKKRINCDVTLRKHKKSVGFSHIVIGPMDLPVKNDEKSKERYMVQMKVLAQKIVYMITRGTDRVDFDKIG